MSGFDGFPKEMIKFFAALQKNNGKSWFEAHRADYKNDVQQPSREFVAAMGERLKKISPKINAIPKINQSLFRIHRDTRFSKVKSPYKTNLGIWFWEGMGKRMGCPGFYFHLENKKMMLGVGLHIFSSALLTRYREAAIDKKLGSQLKKTVNQITRKGYIIGGQHYKRVPRGYDASHKNAALLLHNGLTARFEANNPQELYSKDVIEYVFSHFKQMSPIQKWLVQAFEAK